MNSFIYNNNDLIDYSTKCKKSVYVLYINGMKIIDAFDIDVIYNIPKFKPHGLILIDIAPYTISYKISEKEICEYFDSCIERLEKGQIITEFTSAMHSDRYWIIEK